MKPESKNKFFLLVAGLLFVCFGAGAFLGMELYLNKRFPEGKKLPVEIVAKLDQAFVFQFKAASVGTEGGVTYQTNNYGMRRVQHVQPEAELRILSYGDSIGTGYGVKQSQAYPQRAERRLRQRFKSLDLYNMARGSSPTIYGMHLKRDLAELKPSAVLIEVEFLNDISDEARIRTTGRDKFALAEKILSARYIAGIRGDQLAGLYWRGSWLERTLTYNYFSRTIGNRMRDGKNPVFSPDSHRFYYSLGFDIPWLHSKHLQAGANRLVDALVGIQNLLASQGIPLTVMAIPAKYYFSEGKYRNYSRFLYRNMIKRMQANGIEVLDPSERLARAGGGNLYFDFCHPTKKGHGVLAEIVAEYLGNRFLRRDWIGG